MDERHTTQAKKIRAKWRTFAVAGTLSLVAVSCGGDDAASENSTSTTNTTPGAPTASTEPELSSGAAPTAAPAPTTASTAESTTPLTTSVTTTVPESMPGWSGQTFGRVRALFFEPAATFDAPENSTLLCPPTPRHTGIDVGAGAGGPVPAGGAEAGLLVMRLSDTTVDATVETIIDGLSSATAPQPDVIGGAAGVTFDWTAPAGDAGTLYIGPQSDCTLKFDAGDLWRFWVVDVDQTPVTFAVWGTSTDFDRSASDLEGVVRTFEWTDASTD
jgi:hypothetical protein